MTLRRTSVMIRDDLLKKLRKVQVDSLRNGKPMSLSKAINKKLSEAFN